MGLICSSNSAESRRLMLYICKHKAQLKINNQKKKELTVERSVWVWKCLFANDSHPGLFTGCVRFGIAENESDILAKLNGRWIISFSQLFQNCAKVHRRVDYLQVVLQMQTGVEEEERKNNRRLIISATELKQHMASVI